MCFAVIKSYNSQFIHRYDNSFYITAKNQLAELAKSQLEFLYPHFNTVPVEDHIFFKQDQIDHQEQCN